MNIAIIAPSPVPFTIGGAEKFWWGLHQAINQYSTHQAELIKLPSPENNFLDLIDSYQRFCYLDLSHFDMVISSKYPAWMVEHPNHHCYMVHRLRGLYDTYHFTGQPLAFENPHPELTMLLKIIESSCYERAELALFWPEWERVRTLLKNGQIAEDVFNFPGPLARRIIHFLDNIALSPNAIQQFSAISHNLIGREDYFPDGARVKVIHPPSDVEDFKPGRKSERPYIFTMSRLDQPKRIGLLIKAFRQTSDPIDFRIAGTGPEEQCLKELAGDDKRIIFLGRITDKQAIEEYSSALFVPFIPYDEDYGLITIEAMKSQKAVLTTTDAGGVNEFVENGVSGYSVEPDAESLATAMRQLFADSENCQQMGRNALKKVDHVNWQTVVEQLLQENKINPSTGFIRENYPVIGGDHRGKRKKIVVVLTFSVFPPRGGGQSRAYNIYREVAREHDVTLVLLLDQEKHKKKQQQNIQSQEILIAPNMREIRVSKSKEQLIYEHELFKLLGTPVEDIACIEGYKLTPHFNTVLAAACQSADLVVACHPYLFYAIQEVWDGTVWYEAQDVEVDIKRAIIGHQEAADSWLEKTRLIEERCSVFAEKIFTCSEKDATRIAQLYQQPEGKLFVVPNGVDMRIQEELTAKQLKAYRQIKSLTSTQNRFVVLFMGSWHGPNIEAVEELKQIATECPKADFLLLGSVCEHPKCCNFPANIKSLGMVSEIEKNLYLHFADLAVNPVLSGSGTNLKMLDYTANSLPVLTTPFGLRGLSFIPKEEVLSAEINDFANVINYYAGKLNKPEKVKLLKDLAQAALKRTEKEYSWQVIAEEILKRLKE